jgi:sulfatase modifying factor 1
MRENCVSLLLVIVGYQPFDTRMKDARLNLLAVLFAAFVLSSTLHAQPLVTIDTVTVGDAGNAADTTGYGAVADVFAIGKYEVTIGQYIAFLNSVAASDPYGLWNVNMSLDANQNGIQRVGIAGSYIYEPVGPEGLAPTGASSPSGRAIGYVNWFDAARFANWMHNGATNGAETETGAYSLNGATNGIAPARNPDARWWIPTEDQWYKAAYHKADSTNAGYWLFPTQSDQVPGNTIGSATNQANWVVLTPATAYSVTQAPYDPAQNYLADVGAYSGSEGPYGTFDQAGSLYEWNDLDGDSDSSRGSRGGGWADFFDTYMRSSGRAINSADLETFGLGFRLATVPEPSTYALLAISAAGALWWARRRR